MRCPYCEGSMQVGKATVEESALGTVFGVVNSLTGGFSWIPHSLYFRTAGGGEAICVDHTRGASYCPKCQALLIGPGDRESGKKERTEVHPEPATEEPNPTNCPACGTALAVEDTRCPSCDIALR